MKRQLSLLLLLMVLSSASSVQADLDNNQGFICVVADDNGKNDKSVPLEDEEEPECD